MDNKYTGMSINERLYVSGLLNEFDVAVKDKNVDRVISILKQVELTEPNIGPILEKFGLKSAD
jgi:hypothetical protein